MIIESNVFEGCESLVDVDISVGVAGIGAGAFTDCTALTSLIIPRTVEVIGADAFSGCDSLTIFAEADELPSGWVPTFNPDDRPIVFGAIIDITQLNMALQKYLSRIEAAELYLTQDEAADVYLSKDAAASTYLSKGAAEQTYFKASAISNYYSKTEANTRFLTKTDASDTYALKSALSSYLTTTAASNTYLSKAAASSTYLSKTEAANTYATKNEISSVYKYKGEVNTFGDLPSNAQNGDVYNVKTAYGNYPADTNYAWDGTKWDALGGDIASILSQIAQSAPNGITVAVEAVPDSEGEYAITVAIQNADGAELASGTTTFQVGGGSGGAAPKLYRHDLYILSMANVPLEDQYWEIYIALTVYNTHPESYKRAVEFDWDANDGNGAVINPITIEDLPFLPDYDDNNPWCGLACSGNLYNFAYETRAYAVAKNIRNNIECLYIIFDGGGENVPLGAVEEICDVVTEVF